MEPTEERWYSPNGRIRRSTWAARVFGVGFAMAMVVFAITALMPHGRGESLAVIPTLFLALGFFVFRILQDIKRLHDLGRSGWFVLAAFIPGINLIYVIIILFSDGQPFPNEYGLDPKGRGSDVDAQSVADVFR